VTEVLLQRGLGRARLARQYLLDRVTAPAIDVIGHLAGMQAQAPLALYMADRLRPRPFGRWAGQRSSAGLTNKSLHGD
jgi:hypothetical protein